MQNENVTNADIQVVSDFGDEWQSMDQVDLPEKERLEMFNQYFSLFPWDDSQMRLVLMLDVVVVAGH